MNVIKSNIKKILVGQLKNFQVNEDFIELILYFIIGAFDKIVFFIYNIITPIARESKFNFEVNNEIFSFEKRENIKKIYINLIKIEHKEMDIKQLFFLFSRS